MEYLYAQIQTITQIYTAARIIQKYFNTLFLKSSTLNFVASITVTGKLFHILRVEEKRINIKVSLQQGWWSRPKSEGARPTVN